MWALFFLSRTVLGVWRASNEDPNTRGIYISDDNAAQWPSEEYLFDVPDMPLIHEVDEEGEE